MLKYYEVEHEELILSNVWYINNNKSTKPHLYV